MQAGREYEIEEIRPHYEARPDDVAGIADALRFASRGEFAVVVWGGGTRIGLGNIPTGYDMALDVTGLDRVVDHTPGDLTATVEAGITISALQEALGRHGQFLAVDPPLPDRATLGGTLAIGTSGPLKWQYGSIRDTVIGMKVVQADGTVTKSGGQVVKNVSGFEMARMHIGALGTLGVIAEVSLKLTPRPRRGGDCAGRLRPVGSMHRRCAGPVPKRPDAAGPCRVRRAGRAEDGNAGRPETQSPKADGGSPCGSADALARWTGR